MLRFVILDWLIAGYCIAFLGWYWLVAFNTYDRYLHSLIPLLALLGARALVGLWCWAGVRRGVLLAVTLLLIAATLPAVLTTLRGEASIAGDQGQHAGIDTLADYLNTHLAGETVYDHWLGWELAYYLGPAPRVTLRYMAFPEALPADLAAQPDPPHLFVAPSPDHAALWLLMLDRAGIATAQRYHDSAHGFVVYELNLPHMPLGSAYTLTVYSEWIRINGRIHDYE